MKKPYLYQGLEASLYDTLDELADFDDYSFYRWLVEIHPGSVLDVGCGTGRILAQFLEEGIDAYGLDASAEMLAVCREKLSGVGGSERLFEGDMRNFDLGRTFDTIMIPGFSLQMLEGADEVERCLARCREHLKPEGLLVLSFYIPLEYLEGNERSGPMEERKRKQVKGSSDSVVAYQSWEIDEEKRRMRLENVYVHETIGKEVLRKESSGMNLNWYEVAEMADMLRLLGFDAVQAYGDFLFEEYEKENECFCLVANRAVD